MFGNNLFYWNWNFFAKIVLKYTCTLKKKLKMWEKAAKSEVLKSYI